ncbi:MAG: AbrB/MazE/SpoVT family DNA-binding domain-containing protein [Ignavibacteriota bacterium]
METTRLSTKGQVILPEAIRDSRSWRPGTAFIVVETNEGVLLRPMPPFPRTTLDKVAGCLRSKSKKSSAAKMDAAIGREVKRRHDSGRY